MKNSKLAMLNFMALCCVLGIFTKKIINPFANLITDALHIPGGVGTAFSIMFLVIATEVVRCQTGNQSDRLMRKCGTLMGCVQGFLSLALGRVGSMGILMPVGFIASGIGIDIVYYVSRHVKLSRVERMVFANALATVMASLTANVVVFHLWGAVLMLYLCVGAMSGILFGILGSAIVKRLTPVLSFGWNVQETKTE